MKSNREVAESLVEAWDCGNHIKMSALDQIALAQSIAAALDAKEKETLEGAAQFLEKTRCRTWSPEECARKLRTKSSQVGKDRGGV